jgi:hypothetical protein
MNAVADTIDALLLPLAAALLAIGMMVGAVGLRVPSVQLTGFKLMASVVNLVPLLGSIASLARTPLRPDRDFFPWLLMTVPAVAVIGLEVAVLVWLVRLSPPKAAGFG